MQPWLTICAARLAVQHRTPGAAVVVRAAAARGACVANDSHQITPGETAPNSQRKRKRGRRCSAIVCGGGGHWDLGHPHRPAAGLSTAADPGGAARRPALGREQCTGPQPHPPQPLLASDRCLTLRAGCALVVLLGAGHRARATRHPRRLASPSQAAAAAEVQPGAAAKPSHAHHLAAAHRVNLRACMPLHLAPWAQARLVAGHPRR